MFRKVAISLTFTVLKVKHFEEAKRKTERFHKHLEQQFLKEQERKTVQWKKASEKFEKSLEVFSRRGGKASVPATSGPVCGHRDAGTTRSRCWPGRDGEIRPESSSRGLPRTGSTAVLVHPLTFSARPVWKLVLSLLQQ